MKVRDVSLVPPNFEKLTVAQRARIPTEAYLRAVARLSFGANQLIAPVLPPTSPSASEKSTLPDVQAVPPEKLRDPQLKIAEHSSWDTTSPPLPKPAIRVLGQKHAR